MMLDRLQWMVASSSAYGKRSCLMIWKQGLHTGFTAVASLLLARFPHCRLGVLVATAMATICTLSGWTHVWGHAVTCCPAQR